MEAPLASAPASASVIIPVRDPLMRGAWVMVWLSMLGTMCCSTSVILINTGIFMKPLAASFGWSRASLALSLSLAALSMAAANPFVGKLIDRYGVRPVLIASLVGYSATAAAMPVLVQTGGLWGLYLGYIAIAAIGAGSNVIAYVRILSGWFTGPLDGLRGLALGISAAGVPLGATLSQPLGVLLIAHFGWSGAFYGLALMPLCIGLPVAVFGIRMAPDELRHSATGAEGQRVLAGASLSEASRTRAFWLLLVIVLLMSTCLQGIAIHTAPLLSDFGLSANGLAVVLALSGVMGIVGRVGAGYLFDRFFAPLVSIAIFGVAALAAFGLVVLPVVIVGVIATLLVTLGSGAESDFVGYVVGRYFGLRCYGEIFGVIYGMFMVGIAVGPYLFGLAFDHWGDYRIAFMMAALGLVVLCGLLMLMPRFGPQVQQSSAT